MQYAAWAVILTVTLAGFVASTVGLRRALRAQERRERAWEAERKDLLDRVMYMAEKPWNLPEVPQAPELDWDREPLPVWPELESE